jgi:hypothetical protein
VHHRVSTRGNTELRIGERASTDCCAKIFTFIDPAPPNLLRQAKVLQELNVSRIAVPRSSARTILTAISVDALALEHRDQESQENVLSARVAFLFRRRK